MLGAAAHGVPRVARAAASASPPPAPDYSHGEAWAAWPGRPSGADSLPPGVDDSPALAPEERVDVFFIHPTTYLSGGATNARFDEPGVTTTRIDRGVLRFQASAFNGCCRIYAPHYRQAALGAFLLEDEAAAAAAYEIAYADVARAFDYYLSQQNHGRPFIIASHSQGSLHALRLLQQRVAHDPQQQLLVAYVVGYQVPAQIEAAGVPVCRAPRQLHCLVSWNTVKAGTSDSPRRNHVLVWLDGRYQPLPAGSPLCVNPLTWTVDGEAPAASNLGALPAVPAGAELLPLVPHLAGARCAGGALQVAIPRRQRGGFADLLTLFGSYHVLDYNLFYANVRADARERVQAYRAAVGR